MKHTLVRAKLHRVTVTGCDLNYEGSILIGRDLLTASGILPFELVHVNNINNASHWETYVIPHDEPGTIILNGAPARLFLPGDLVVIMAFTEVNKNEIEDHMFTSVSVTSDNVVKQIKTYKFNDLY